MKAVDLAKQLSAVDNNKNLRVLFVDLDGRDLQVKEINIENSSETGENFIVVNLRE